MGRKRLQPAKMRKPEASYRPTGCVSFSWINSVVTATRYGLDGPGIEARCWRKFPCQSKPALEPTQPPVQWVPGLFRGVKRPGRGVDHPPISSAEVKERVEL
jgi:hypothetical protein